MRFGRFRIDRDRLVLAFDEAAVALPPKSVELLAVLAERSGELVTKRELLDRLWPETAVEESNLSQHVYLIRKTLEGYDSAARRTIVTVPKRGYRFVPLPAPENGSRSVAALSAGGSDIAATSDQAQPMPPTAPRRTLSTRPSFPSPSARRSLPPAVQRSLPPAARRFLPPAARRSLPAVARSIKERIARGGKPRIALPRMTLPPSRFTPPPAPRLMPPPEIVTTANAADRGAPDLIGGAPVRPSDTFGPLRRSARCERGGRRALRAVAAAAAGLMLIVCAAATVAHRRPGPPPLSAEGSTAARLGRYYLDLRTRVGIARSRSYFARVVSTDARNPAGYAGLADAFTMTADYGGGSRPAMTYLRWAQRAARRAAGLDADSAAAHASLGIIAHYLRDDRTARAELQRAVGLDYAYAPAHHWLGTLLFDNGEFTASLRELEIAAQLNPMSTASNAWLSMAAYFEHRYDTAIEHGRRALELDPARSDSLRELGLAYAAEGKLRAALVTFERIPRASSDAKLVPLLVAAVYAQSGQSALARRIVARERRRHAASAELPFTLLALGDRRGAALAALQARPHDCSEQRRYAADPRFDRVRTSAAFGSVLRGSCARTD